MRNHTAPGLRRNASSTR